MGLLGKLQGNKPAKAPSDDVLLLHAIFCIAAADGTIEDREDELIRAYANTLPEFRDMDGHAFTVAMEQSVKIARDHDRDMKASLVALEAIHSDAVRKKAFVLAVDIAMSSGAVDEREDEMLEAMQQVLRIDDALAHKIVDVISLKYQQ